MTDLGGGAWHPDTQGSYLADIPFRLRATPASQPPTVTLAEAAHPMRSATLQSLTEIVLRRGPQVDKLAVSAETAAVETVVRGPELVTTFALATEPIRVTLYWLLGGSEKDNSSVIAPLVGSIEAEVLLQTDARFEAVELLTESRLDVEDVLLLCGPPGNEAWTRLTPPTRDGEIVFPRDAAAAALTYDGRHEPLQAMWTAPPGAWPIALFRLPGGNVSYCELASPLDAGRVILRRSGDGLGLVWRVALFGRDLEKGVIQRGRVRGVWIDRRDDEQQALRIYRDFLAMPPHLAA